MPMWGMRKTVSKFFTYEGDPMLACPCCGDKGMALVFLRKLDKIREEYGKPMIVSSGYRCAKYNASMSSTGFCGPHTTGRAVDICVSRGDALSLVKIALDNGITGLGVNQKGSYNKRIIHLDDLSGNVRPWIWSY